MKRLWTDICTAAYSVFPMLLCFAFAYLMCSFIAWSRDPSTWSWDMRFCMIIFSVCLGFSIDNRFEYERNQKK